MADHGTAARAQQHRKDGEPVCPSCLVAWNATSRKNRARIGERGRKAMRILRDRHLSEYMQIMFELREADNAKHQ